MVPPASSKGANDMALILRRSAIAIVFLILCAFRANGQGTLEDYQRAQKFLPGNARHLYTSGDVMAHWIDKTDRFWDRTMNTKEETEFIVVDAAQNTAGPAFDHKRLAESLS